MSAGSILAVDQKEAAAAPARTLEGLLLVALTAVQLLLLAFVVRVFELESRGLYHTLLLSVAGFSVHALLPKRWRMACFALLSLASVGLLFGQAGLWVVGFGALVIGLSLVPIRFGAQMGLLLGMMVVLGLARQEVFPVAMPAYIWPVIAGMFMFRLVLYFYTIKHEGRPKDLWGTVAYLFMLPNAVFPFFPIVDYKSFLRRHYDAPESALYARGIAWMVRGLTHLLLYRVVYHYVVLDPAVLRTLGDVVQYCLQTYLLYLRVSGQFHLIIGLLYLFGFRLPPTHHLYFLADSFTEVWRRVNTYWKDFMMKVAYHPTFFRLRKLGTDRAIVLSTIIVMLITWLLHGYQKFWIVGGSPFSAVDTVFWLILGTLVVLSAVWDLYRAKRREPPRTGYDLARAVRTLFVFGSVCMLFTLWTSESLDGFLNIMRVARNVDARGVVLLLGIVALFLAVGGRSWGDADIRELTLQPIPMPTMLKHGGAYSIALLGLVGLAQPEVRTRLGPTAAGVITQIASSRLNQRDEDQLTRGYYESISSPNRLSGQLWDVRQEQPADWINIEETSGFRTRPDFLASDLVPGQTITFKRQTFRINSHGMHDREYTVAKPEHTYRIAIFGASPVMGPGVPDGQAFESLLEDRLTALGAASGWRVEVLNFGVAGYSGLQQVEKLETQALAFHPDLLIITSLPPDRLPEALHLGYVIRGKVPVPDSALRAALAPLDSSASPDAILRAVSPIMDSLIASVVVRTDQAARNTGAKAALLVLRLPEYADSRDRVMVKEAKRLGMPVIDLSQPYGTFPEGHYRLADYDRHWNLAGHQLIADKLEDELRRRAAELGLPPLWNPAPGAGPARP